ncbi:ABC transporter ATP-binding protein [Sediminitomix flava]|uniref:ABC transporter fused permease/ATP-binding protein n=1 Tax=Sediminitomix flava TaxID=379075 RepID=A0A315YVJ4_SEDFL|nr:ABC transporter transmembrane domain-containing protein [Sediminitomix flava]PWJ33683.1 ABC transporter fused permease/ATP-binding protein [Sediminitomix flava]
MAFFRNLSKKKGEKEPAIGKEGFRALWGIFRFILPYKHYFIPGLICLFFSSTILMAFPYFIGELIGEAVKIQQNESETSLWGIAIILFAILGAQSIFSFFRVYLFAQANERAIADMRATLYEKFMFLPITFYDKRRSGELFSRITADVSSIQEAFSTTLAELIRQTLTLVVGIAFLLVINMKLTFFMIGTLPIVILSAVFFGKFIRKLSKETQDTVAKTNVVVEETLQAISTVKAFANEFLELTRYKKRLDDVVAISLRTATYRGVFISFIIFVLMGSIVVMLWFASNLVAQGEIGVDGLVSFAIYAVFIGGSIGGLGEIYSNLQKAVGATDRIEEILNQTEEPRKEGIKNESLQGEVSYENVKFAYPTRPDIEVLKGIDLNIKAGEKVALVGHSGAGKSTIIQTLLRFYDVSNGDIKIDGKSIGQFDLHTYRSQIGMVPQEVILFGGTIRENIAYGNPNATEEEIRMAAKKANALDFIEKFPEGLNTLVGERGVQLSGGQRQRVAIARAILRDPKILILDEATSSLDSASEKMVQDALEHLMQGRTTIIIAHRLSTIRKVDRIYVLDEGQVSESGTHSQLAEQDGMYQHLLSLQVEK